jgi:hypothetical protein
LWQKLLRDSSFFLALLLFDRDLAERYRKEGCVCGGKLHRAAYFRKPRGEPFGLPEGFCVRESFCCCREGCRRRVTPPSLRFLGRRVYLSAVVVVVSTMVDGITEKRAAAMRELVGVSRRTLHRWRRWWRESFVRTEFWRVTRARFSPPVEEQRLPASMLERVGRRGEPSGVLVVLELLKPLTAGTRCAVAR